MTNALRVLPALLTAMALLAACGAPPAPSPAASPVATDAAATDPAPGSGAVDPALPRACLGLADPDCGQALDAAAGVVDGLGPIAYVEVGPFGCRDGEGCPPTLLARPSGQVTFEPAAGDPIAVMVTLGPDGVLTAERGEAFTIRLDPSSAAGQLTGPIPFSLGHCGLGSGVDVDGSWWDPVGFVNSDHGDSINAADGTFAPTDPNRATFTSDGGLVATLLRRTGPKHLPLCQ